MKGRTASLLSWSLWGVMLAIVAVTGVVLAVSWDTLAPPNSFGFRGFGSVAGLVFATVGALVASRRRENPIGWLLLATGVGFAVQELAQQYAIYALIAESGSVPGGALAAWLTEWVWLPLLGLVSVFLFPIFPTGRLLSPGWKWIPWVGGIGILVGSLGQGLVRDLFAFRGVRNPLGGIDNDTLAPIAIGAILLFIVGIIGATASLVVRFRRSRGDERQQVKWLAYAAGLVAISLILVAITSAVGGSLEKASADWIENLVIVSFIGIPLATGIAVLKYRLYDIDLVISRAVVFGLLAAFITLVYVAIVVGVGAAVGTSGDVVLSAVAAAVVALAFQPLRRRAQHVANRLVYGKRATPYEVLSSFGDRVAGGYSIQDILPRMARMLGEATGAERADVWLSSGTELRAAAPWPAGVSRPTAVGQIGDDLPDLPGADAAAAVRHQGELLGALSLAKRPGEPVTPAEEKLLADLASQAGLVLRNVGLVEELRESRKRIVAAQDERAKALERNIHDGAQQQLVALSVKLRLAESLVKRDPDKTQQLLEELQSETGDALENLRDLARGIYPPLLADKGLSEALGAQARRAPIPVAVESDGARRYPQEVEAAAYFCTLEALQNASKYAGPSRVTVRLGEANGPSGLHRARRRRRLRPQDNPVRVRAHEHPRPARGSRRGAGDLVGSRGGHRDHRPDPRAGE